jgi:hypothetical protein
MIIDIKDHKKEEKKGTVCAECGEVHGEEEMMFVHSACCNAHWELVIQNNQYSLRCEACGMPMNSLLVIPQRYKNGNVNLCHTVTKDLMNDVTKAAERLKLRHIVDVMLLSTMFCLPSLLDEKDDWLVKEFGEMME